MKEGKEINIIKSPKWVAILSSISIGWLIFIIFTFFGVMAVGTILNSINAPITSDSGIIATFIVAALLGILLGGIIGKSLYRWFCNRKRSTGIILLITLGILALGFIPQPFIYVTM